MRSLSIGVSTILVFPHSNLQFLPEQRQYQTCPIGFLKLWSGLGVSSLHGLTRIKTPSQFFSPHFNRSKNMKRLHKGRGNHLWRAELAQDAPFVIAIGACMFTSLLFVQDSSLGKKPSDSSPEDSDDMRDGAISIISFIPLFNWLGWVFAWLDSKEKRYLFYAVVYLAPYLRTGLSLSPDDSWLPIASIIAGIVHWQLEVNLKSGAQLGNNFLGDAVKQMDTKFKLPKLTGQGKRYTEQPPPEPTDQQFIAEEELHRRDLLDFDKALSSLDDFREEKFGKSDQIESERKAYNPEKSDD